MRGKGHRVGMVTAFLGLILVVAHIAVAAVATFTLGRWIGGAAIGFVVMALAAVHLVVGHRHRRP